MCANTPNACASVRPWPCPIEPAAPEAAQSLAASDREAAARVHLTPAQRRGIAHTTAPVAAVPLPEPWPYAEDRIEPLRGVRRQMARSMAEAHAQVVPTTIFDDADLGDWGPDQDLTARLLRAIVAGCRAEPGLNAWFDGERGERRLHARVDVGVAVDTPEGLFVVALRHCERRNLIELRAELDRLRHAVAARQLPPADLSGYTIMLSNFGKFAGRYATPVIVPPCVAILAAGRLRHEAVPVLGGFAARKRLPLSSPSIIAPSPAARPPASSPRSSRISPARGELLGCRARCSWLGAGVWAVALPADRALASALLLRIPFRRRAFPARWATANPRERVRVAGCDLAPLDQSTSGVSSIAHT